MKTCTQILDSGSVMIFLPYELSIRVRTVKSSHITKSCNNDTGKVTTTITIEL